MHRCLRPILATLLTLTVVSASGQDAMEKHAAWQHLTGRTNVTHQIRFSNDGLLVSWITGKGLTSTVHAAEINAITPAQVSAFRAWQKRQEAQDDQLEARLRAHIKALRVEIDKLKAAQRDMKPAAVVQIYQHPAAVSNVWVDTDWQAAVEAQQE